MADSERWDYNSSYDNSTCPPSMDSASNGLVILAYLVILVVGLLGNTLVIYVVLRFSKMQTVTNTYIVNMAIADECFLTSIPFLVATTLAKGWPFGRTMCKIYMTVIGINQFTSSIFITIMSADRYIAICHPIVSPKLRTPAISITVAVIAWMVSAIMVSPVAMYSDARGDESDGRLTCNIFWPNKNDTGNLPIFQFINYVFYSFTLTFAIPVILIVVFYILVIKKLRTVGPKNKSKEMKKCHRKVTKLVLTVIAVYVFCWTPYWVGQLILSFKQDDEDKTECLTHNLFILFHLISSVLSMANSAMNPVLYAFLSDNFKKSFLKACVCATQTDVNACLQAENSVLPKRSCKLIAEKNRGLRRTSQLTAAEDTNEEAQLVSKGDSVLTATTTASRSNVTFNSEVNVTGVTEHSSGKEALEQTTNGVKTAYCQTLHVAAV